jgi:CBS domain-containing protein
MATVATDITARVAELSDGAFVAFCDDIGGMFGVDMQCVRRESCATTVGNLRESLKGLPPPCNALANPERLTAVHIVKADGILNGRFHLLFDQGGLFILSGVIVMLSESRILDEVKRGSLEEAMNLQDAAREVGNLLVGSWDRVFREDCPGHGHFVKSGTFLGKTREAPDRIELQTDTEVTVVLYELTVDSYPSFTCAALFPSEFLKRMTAADAAPVATVVARSEPPEDEEETRPPIAKHRVGDPELPWVADLDAVPVPLGDPERIVPTSHARHMRSPPSAPEPAGSDSDSLPSELAAAQSVLSFLDADYVQSSPPASLTEFLNTPVSQIMDKEVIWAEPEETVQDVIARMQQHNVGYVLIGAKGILEGMVSGSNILGAVSLYLRPTFAKWRRPQDDATLGVKVKWIMSRPVRTVRPDATVATVIENMCRCGGRCLPVADAKGSVQGIVTVFDILLRILGFDKKISWRGRPPQAPPLLV